MELTTSQPTTIELQDATDFITALKAGKTAREAAEGVGKPLSDLLRQTIVKRRLEELQAYHMERGETRDKVVDSALMEILLMDPDAKNKTAAAKLLKDKDDAPLVNISISDELRGLSTKPLWPEEEGK